MIRGLSADDRIILQCVRDAGNNGILSTGIKDKINVPTRKVSTILKRLEKQNLVKSIKTVQAKNKIV